MRSRLLDLQNCDPIPKRAVRLGYLLVIVILSGTYVAGIAQAHRAVSVSQAAKLAQHANELHDAKKVSDSLAELRRMEAVDRQAGLDTSAVTAALPQITQLIASANYVAAAAKISSNQQALVQLLARKQFSDAAAEAAVGLVSGTISDGSVPLAGVVVTLSGTQNLPSVTTDATGSYRFTVPAGTYTIQATQSGYVSSPPQILTVVAQNLTTITIVLSKIPPPAIAAQPVAAPPVTAPRAPTPPSQPVSSGDSAPYSTYTHTTLNGHTADIMSFDLSSGHIRVMVDTANDTDCQTNCNVQSVGSFVQQDRGFAGINGSYFCPTAYGASCAGKTNSFYWKEYNSRVGRMINPTNTLGEQDPFMVFNANGHATLLQHWVQYPSAGSIYAGFSCNPLLIYGGQNVLNVGALDDKERTAYISRAAIALKGQTLYSVVIQGATVPDLAATLMTLGVDGAINSDAGGSSGMYYNGQYRLGPGRAVPNALVFVEQ